MSGGDRENERKRGESVEGSSQPDGEVAGRCVANTAVARDNGTCINKTTAIVTSKVKLSTFCTYLTVTIISGY